MTWAEMGKAKQLDCDCLTSNFKNCFQNICQLQNCNYLVSHINPNLEKIFAESSGHGFYKREEKKKQNINYNLSYFVH